MCVEGSAVLMKFLKKHFGNLCSYGASFASVFCLDVYSTVGQLLWMHASLNPMNFIDEIKLKLMFKIKHFLNCYFTQWQKGPQ